ncbi:hypothetical protein MRX96_015360 [Rhipicephalus microplus]
MFGSRLPSGSCSTSQCLALVARLEARSVEFFEQVRACVCKALANRATYFRLAGASDLGNATAGSFQEATRPLCKRSGHNIQAKRRYAGQNEVQCSGAE